MARRRTGLRNRKRTGRSTYSKLGKARSADYYGSYVNGRQVSPERIAR
jgi:hypothetical protein